MIVAVHFLVVAVHVHINPSCFATCMIASFIDQMSSDQVDLRYGGVRRSTIVTMLFSALTDSADSSHRFPAIARPISKAASMMKSYPDDILP